MSKGKGRAQESVKVFSINTKTTGSLERVPASPSTSSSASHGPNITLASTIAVDVARTAAKFNSANVSDLQAIAAATQRAQIRLDTDGIPLRDPYTHASSWLFSFPCVDSDVPYIPTYTKDPSLGNIQFGELVRCADKNLDADPKSELLRDVIRDHINAFAWSAADLVGVDQSKIPETNIAFDIKLKPEFMNQSIYQRDRKYSQLEHEVMDEYYGDLLKLAFIELAAPGTPHALTTVIAPKKAEDGTWVDTRVCTNTVPLNDASFLDRYQTATLDELFQSMSGAEIFSCIDCKSGYHQLANTEATKKLLSFHWRSKLYSWTRMPFGPASAPAHWQRVVDCIFRGMETFCLCYLDDIIIYSSADSASGLSAIEVHATHLRKVLSKMEEVKLRAHPGKTIIGTAYCSYLGFMISPGKMTPAVAKVRAILALKSPKNKHDLMSVMGLLNYYRAFDPSFSKLARPLNNLLKGEAPKEFGSAWTDECEEAFHTLKRNLARPGCAVRLPIAGKRFTLHTDFSNCGVGCLLTQCHEVEITLDDGSTATEEREVIIAAISRSLNSFEQNYSSFDGEMLAATYGVRAMRYHLQAVEFDLVTDHRPLMWLQNRANLLHSGVNNKHKRWWAMLSDFTFVVKWRKGTEHVPADVLSRHAIGYTGDFTGSRLDHMKYVETAFPQPADASSASDITRRTACEMFSLSAALATSSAPTPHCLDSFQNSRNIVYRTAYGAYLSGHDDSDEEDTHTMHTRPRPPAAAAALARKHAWSVWQRSPQLGASVRIPDSVDTTPHSEASSVLLLGGKTYAAHTMSKTPWPTFRQLPLSGMRPSIPQSEQVLVQCLYWCKLKQKICNLATYQTLQQLNYDTKLVLDSTGAALNRSLAKLLEIEESQLVEYQVYEARDTTAPYQLREQTLCNKGVAGTLKEAGTQGVLIAPLAARPIQVATWHNQAAQQGITLIELCAGISTTLEAVLQAGFAVRKYHYCDNDKAARKVAARRAQLLLKEFPHLVNKDSLVGAHQIIPQNVLELNFLHAQKVFDTAKAHRSPILVCVGWPCQDLSRAGKSAGLKGLRSGLIQPISTWISRLQDLQAVAGSAGIQVAYILENVMFQSENDRLQHPSTVTRPENHQAESKMDDLELLTTALGKPTCFDAAAVGSGSHRLRFWWSNLITPTDAQLVFDSLHANTVYKDNALSDILDPCHEMPLSQYNDRPPYAVLNRKGATMQALPTLMATTLSRAFLPGKQGSLRNLLTGNWEEPSPEERERAMGVCEGTTAAEGLSNKTRNKLLGNAMDLGAVTALLALIKERHLFESAQQLTPTHQQKFSTLSATNKRYYASKCGLKPRGTKGWNPETSDKALRTSTDEAAGTSVCENASAKVIPARPMAPLAQLRKRYGEIAVRLMLKQGHHLSYALGLGPHVLEPPLTCSKMEPCSHCRKPCKACHHQKKAPKPCLGYEGPCNCPANTEGLSTPIQFVSSGVVQKTPSLGEIILPSGQKSAQVLGSAEEAALEVAVFTMGADHLESINNAWARNDICLRTEVQLVRDQGGRGHEPYEDQLLLRHLKGESLQDITDSMPERRRISLRAPAYTWQPAEPPATEGTLLRVSLSGHHKIVPPPQARRALIQKQHIACRHLGMRRTAALLAQTYFWNNMEHNVRLVVGACEACARKNTSFTADVPILHSLAIMALCYRWSADYGKLPITKHGYCRFLIFVEHLSRYIVLCATKDKESATTAAVYQDRVFSIWGVAGEMLTDRGQEFQGAFDALLTQLGTRHRLTSAFHPQSNGMSERVVQIVKASMAKLAANYTHKSKTAPWDWTRDLPYLQLAFNCSPQSSTKNCPSSVMMAQHPTVPPAVRSIWSQDLLDLDSNDGSRQTAIARLVERTKEIKRLGIQVAANLELAQQRDKATYAKRHSGSPKEAAVNFQAGDWVYTFKQKHNALSLQTSKRPYKVVQISPLGVVTLSTRDNQLFEKHYSKLAPCHLDIDLEQTERLDYESTSCDQCGATDNEAMMLLCESCDKGRHLPCFTPPLSANPAGDWYCEECISSDQNPTEVDSHGFTLNAQPDFQAEELRQAPLQTTTEHPPSAPASTPTEADSIDDVACDHCGKTDQEDTLVMCTHCDHGRHIACFSPPIYVVPTSDWFCPSCLNKGLGHRVDEQGFARPALSPAATPTRQSSRIRSNPPTVRRTAAITQDIASIAQYNPLTRNEFDQLCLGNMPGEWPRKTITTDYGKYLDEIRQFGSHISYPPRCSGDESDAEVLERSVAAHGLSGSTLLLTMPTEIHRLADIVDLSSDAVGTIFDPWAGTLSIESVLSKYHGARVISNDFNPASPAQFHMDALRSATYDLAETYAQEQGSSIGAIVTSPHWRLLDMAMPLAIQRAASVVCFHVGAQFFDSAPARRRQFWQKLSDENRRVDVQLSQRNTASGTSRWLIVFKTEAEKRRLCKRTTGSFPTFAS